MTRLPNDIRDRVWERLYRDADAADWENLSARAKSLQYTRWLDDEDVGGLLMRFMDRDDARVYLKDSPLKEYARALAGEGPGAKHTTNRQAAPQTIVRAALGGGWRVVSGSVGIKPMHCVAENGEERRVIYWARTDRLGDLIWAALNKVTDDPNADPLLVIRESIAKPTPTATRDRQRAMAGRCGLELTYVRPSSA